MKDFKKVDFNKIIRILSKKKVQIFESDAIIDISKADELGNKTWGYISFFINKLNFKVTGLGEYKQKCKKASSTTAEEIKIKKAGITIPEHIKNQKESRTYHAYKNIAKEADGQNTSEYRRFHDAIDIINGVNRSFFDRKTKSERIELKERKKVSSFSNNIVFQSEYDVPLKQRVIEYA